MPTDTPATAGDHAVDVSPMPEARGIGGVRVRLGAVLMGLAVLASTSLAVGLYVLQYRPDAQSGGAAADAAREAAVAGSTALLSYAPDTLDADLTAAKSHLTGDFLTYYTQFADEVVAPAAREKSVKTTAEVVRSAVSDLAPDAAKVLIFTNQTTTSSEKPDPTTTASSVLVSLTKEHGTWLISSFDPV
jgi:Mce-associated membrane protein